MRWGLPGPSSTVLGYYPFATRISPDGVVVDDEIPGLLLATDSDAYGSGDGVLAPTATKSLMFRFVEEPTGDGAVARSIVAQGVLAR